MDAASIFGEVSGDIDAAMDRHLDAAVSDFDRVLPRLVSAQIHLVAGTANYAAAADAQRFHSTELVDNQNELDPYDERRVQVVPTPILTTLNGVKAWQFRPAPNAKLLGLLGACYPLTYYAAHKLDADQANTTLDVSQIPLLVLRAQVESLRELAIRNAHKPVALRDPQYSTTKNGTPAALADQFMRMWEQQTRPTSEVYGVQRTTGGGR